MTGVFAKLQDKSLLVSSGLVAGEWKNGQDGKTFPVYEPSSATVVYAASFISWFAEEATRSYGDTIPSSYANTTVLTFKEPVGVCGIITPWNFPAAMITRKIAPAFAAGCSVIIKPPSETPFSALALAKLALAAGIPSDIIHVVPTKDREASMELANNPIVKKLSFTGSTGVGKMLTKAAAGTMKRVSMELGGNAPFIVFDDADIDQAVEGALICKFRCSGQTCVCANRLLVHEAVKDQFIEKLVARVKQYKLGRGIDEGVTQGPLVNAAAVQKVDAHVQDALKKGAVLHTGGKAPEGLKGAAEAPFGGVKESGLGREGSKYGLAEYQNIKSVTIGNLGFN
ncbi:succinate-semialdehyde dehydrogenase [Colletotrichum lupini]|uniref:Succinate-semialdehyde dehydrogenase, mitochondrial n=1 Tax=Colletotrichum lupini TaxID=145971 RepID=A0A9Q8WE99_9PEZI|nr:succinate-semialdehyde dehydrogenase [Colletotrichum lupini]UQC79445.1 succinate-semialdehyde dehydrogenase [Colletotrichum lupini]